MINPPQHPPLAEFQAVMLELLDDNLAPQEIVARLQADPRLADYHDYIATFEPRMVEVAAELIKKWGRRN